MKDIRDIKAIKDVKDTKEFAGIKSNKNAKGKGREKNSSLKKYIVAARYDGMELEEYLKEVMSVSARQRQKLFFSRGVYVNGSSAHTKRLLKSGDMVAIRQFKDTGYGVVPEEGRVEVIYEDNEVIVLNKPAGLLVHPAGQTSTGTLANYLAYYFKCQGQMVTIRPLHRLDRDTTGCVLFAKSSQVQARLEAMLAAGQLHRKYEAVVSGDVRCLQEKFPSGTISLPIGRNPLQPNRRQVMAGGREAVTHFQVLKGGREYSLLQLTLETGRTHQIRVHLAHGGCPVAGDRMYGSRSRDIRRQALHGAELEFLQPVTGRSIVVRAPYPEDMQALLDMIDADC